MRPIRSTTRWRMGSLATGLVLLASAAVAGAQGYDWTRHRDAETVTAITRNEDGSLRETTIWLVVVDGQGVIRTGGTRWGDNVERDPDIALRMGEEEVPVRAEFLTDEGERERAVQAFREKYGTTDWLMSPFRGSHPRIMRLHAR